MSKCLQLVALMYREYLNKIEIEIVVHEYIKRIKAESDNRLKIEHIYIIIYIHFIVCDII